MVKKYFKTYYSIPDKHNKIDIVFERGFRNIQILYNGKEIAVYPSAASLLKTVSIDTPDESLVNIRFLKDTTDFEVHFNAVQIDNSESKPENAVPNLKWPVIVCIAWYGFILTMFCFRTNGLSILMRYPEKLITDPGILYMVTSSLISMLVLSVSLFMLKSGKLFFYYLVIIVMFTDAVYGLISPFYDSFILGYKFDFTMLLILFPLAIKSVVIWVYLTNLNLYKQYQINTATVKRKTNNNLVDL